MYDSRGTVLKIRDELSAAILQHCKANPHRMAYVVPRTELTEQPGCSPLRPNKQCMVIALPDLYAGEIDYASQQIGVDVRTRPDGTGTECMVVAGGAVAISGQAIQAAAGLDLTSPILVAWMFSDSVPFTEYTLQDAHIHDLQAAQQVAQSNAYGELPVTKEARRTPRQVIEIFEHTVVAAGPSRRW